MAERKTFCLLDPTKPCDCPLNSYSTIAGNLLAAGCDIDEIFSSCPTETLVEIREQNSKLLHEIGKTELCNNSLESDILAV
ncbi:MAG: hypothetical protein AAB656_00170 [Patescibacteria group bacterium]